MTRRKYPRKDFRHCSKVLEYISVQLVHTRPYQDQCRVVFHTVIWQEHFHSKVIHYICSPGLFSTLVDSKRTPFHPVFSNNQITWRIDSVCDYAQHHQIFTYCKASVQLSIHLCNQGMYFLMMSNPTLRSSSSNQCSESVRKHQRSRSKLTIET